ncbi:SubName: Full=Uncharacterized protein {ECO:0000313/EMBL:CCA66857.1} [Serendipita indica DSM 11827]|uniref:C2H2-type domain-containing protein n=1 Tax=Serendipita indica (strain DSM 11827) TaxID=1109443 RepID=G4T686_SERID|nr:SubName: Full=Uncharacterized protein {ECO:0000313/EMBL:CCA66857.1} [Serendipita indica DSM 11827]CCA66857.1 hypothetical protein PIIN_00618 [Serendipita indica DSM 11827]
MSFSAVMDEIPSQDPDLEIPTRPVTPVDNTAMLGVPAKKNQLYHSDSVNKVLNELSRNLSGICDNTIFSSKADKMPPPPGVGSQSDIHFAYGFKHNSGEPSFLSGPSGQTALPVMSVSPADCTLTPASKDKTMNVALDLMHFYHSNIPEPPSLSNNLTPRSTSPAQVVSQRKPETSKVDAATTPSLSPLLATSGASPNLLQPQNTSSQSTSSSASSKPGAQLNSILSPTPSTPALSFDGVGSGSDHECRDNAPLPKRPRAPRRATKDSAASTSTAAKSTPSSSKGKGPISPSLPLTPSMPIITPHLQPQIPNGYTVPSSEINSDFEDDGEDEDVKDLTYQQSPYSGGPVREKARERVSEKPKVVPRVKQRHGKEEWSNVAEASHPYKGLKTLGVPSSGNGRQRCSYVSPYDGWKCDQVLARSYDVPRHMEVHAKEEYELVITGKLAAERSDLYTCVTEANMYVCLVCRKDFSRKDAMQRHVRNSAKMSKAKHRAENAKISMKKRVLGDPIVPHPYDMANTESGGGVPEEILDRHRALLNNLKEEAIALGQDVSDWDVEEMVPKLGGGLFGTSSTGELYAGMRDKAPGIPVGRRGGNKQKTEAAKLRAMEELPRTRGANRGAQKKAGTSRMSSQAATPKTNPSTAGGSQEHGPTTESEDDELVSSGESSPEEEEPMEMD